MTPERGEDQQSEIVVLWGRCECYPTPQFVRAWSESFVDVHEEWWFEECRATEREWCEEQDDGPWEFWTTHERIPTPALSTRTKGQP